MLDLKPARSVQEMGPIGGRRAAKLAKLVRCLSFTGHVSIDGSQVAQMTTVKSLRCGGLQM